jgi:histidine kinase
MDKPVIVCVDDEKSVLNALRDEIKFELGNYYTVEVADSGEEGLRLIRELLDAGMTIPVVISDQLMPGMKGDEFLVGVFGIKPNIRKILLTGQASAESVGNAVNNARLYRYIAKPWDAKDLTMTVHQAAQSYQVDQELEARVNVFRALSHSSMELSQEVALAHLKEKILEIALIETTSSNGVLVLFHNDSPYSVSTMARTDEGFSFQEHSLEEIDKHVPMSVFQLVLETKTPIVIERAFKDPNWNKDEHLVSNKVRSVYANIIQKLDELLAVIIFFDRAKASLYIPLRQEFLDVLCTQAAISLDNAWMYEDLEERVVLRTREIEKQKEIIEEINGDLVDSIRYAQRIQKAILPSMELIHKHLPETFVYYKPKAIVSGDFYWFGMVGDFIFVCVVDCTGHGVPGAFMSVMGNSQLNEIILNRKIVETDLILNELNYRVSSNLASRGSDEALQDGMDISVCRIDRKNAEIQYSGANRPFFLYRNLDSFVYMGDKMSIGYSVVHAEDAPKIFKLNRVSYHLNDTIYMFSDGITDQFGGGEKVSKYSKKQLMRTLSAIQHLSLEKQEAEIDRSLTEWKGDIEQTDDILLIGIRLS